jgi:uncharacterized protein YbaR (Trm112 family)
MIPPVFGMEFRRAYLSQAADEFHEADRQFSVSRWCLPAPRPSDTVPRTKAHIIVEGKNMAISQELLDILVCPVCKTPVKFTPDNSGLKCQTCKRVYPVRDEIPVMLPEEAKIAAE